MVASQNLREGTKRLMADNNNMPKKPAKKVKPKRASFGLGVKTQTPLSSQENKVAGFTSSLPSSLNIATPSRIALKESEPSRFGLYSNRVEPAELEPASPILPRRRRKAAQSNQRPSTSKTLEILSDQESTNYLSSATNMVEYKNGCRYFHGCLALIVHDFSINKPQNIFNATLPQFLEDDKEYNRKTAYRIFENEYDWVTDKLIECIHRYARL